MTIITAYIGTRKTMERSLKTIEQITADVEFLDASVTAALAALRREKADESVRLQVAATCILSAEEVFDELRAALQQVSQ